MAKKKQQPVEVKDKVFEVLPATHKELDWPIGWEEGHNHELLSPIASYLFDKGLIDHFEIKDVVRHETLNSFKGDSDNLKAFLFLDTAEFGGAQITKAENSQSYILSNKGTLIIIKGCDYSFRRTPSAKRRVLELVF